MSPKDRARQPDNNSTADNPVGRFMVAVGAVVELGQSGKILISQRSDSLDWHPSEWETVYGRIDQFEDPEDGLRRELREETGLNDLEIVDLLTVWHILRGSEKLVENDLIGITYWCRTQTETIQLSQEHQAYQWVTPDEALKLVQVEGIRRDIQKFVEKNR
jgi:8-oxo-dGTP diphosphatase